MCSFANEPNANDVLFCAQVGSINSSDLELLQSFSAFMRAQLGLPLPYPQPTEPLVCLVKR